MRILPRSTRIFKNNSIFVKLLSFFILLLVFSVFYVGYTSYLNSSKLLVDEVKSHNILSLKQVKNDIDQKISLLDNTTLQIAIDKRVKKAFYIDNGLNASNILLSTEIMHYLSSIKSSAGFIESIILFFNKSDLIITDDGKYDLNTFINNIFVDYKWSKEKWMETCNQYDLFRVISEDDTADNSAKNKTITFARTLPIEIRTPYCTLFINVAKEEFKNIIGNAENENNISIFIMDSKGRIIVGNDITEINKDRNNLVIENIIENSQYSSINQGEFSDLNVNGDLLSVTVINSSKNDWKYVSVIPTKDIKGKTSIIKSVTLATVTISLLIGLLLSYALTQNVYRPINKIINYIEIIQGYNIDLKSEKIKDEINFINRFVNLVFNENKNLTDIINKGLPILKEKLINDLLEGKINEDQLSGFALDVKLDIPFDAFQVVAFEIADYSESMQQILNRTDKNILEIIEDIGSKEPSYSDIRIYSIEKRGGKIISLINMDFHYERPEVIFELANSLIKYFFKEHGISFTAGIGRVYQCPKDILSSYIESLYALKCKMIEGENRVIHIDEVGNISVNPYLYPIESEKQIINFIKSGDYNSLKGTIQEILARNTEGREVSLETIDNLFAALAGTAVRTVYDINSSIQEIFGQGYNIYSELCEKDTFYHKEQYIFNVFKKITDHIDSRRKDKDDILYRDLTNYIEENYSDDISLDTIGDIFSLSPSYMSWKFKEISGKNFVDYLNSFRVDKAKELLKEGNLSVSEVAQRVGFTSSNTFIRVFKKYQGITPGSFKSNCNINYP